MQSPDEADASPAKPPSAFQFHGNWQDFAKIAFPNLLLTIVTLGIYRFWATTREREYLWGQTQFIDERLEWTGKGLELFIGFILVFILIIFPFTIIQFIAQGAIFRGQEEIALVVTLLLFIMIFYLGGVAYFRALRYRLSRTYWRGIRGGSDNPGFFYGLSYMWKSFAGWLPIFLLVPWSSISLWNERWNRMSFGPHMFTSNAQWTDMMKRYMLFYLVPFLMVVGGIVVGVIAATSGDIGAGGGIAAGLFTVLIVLAFYIALPIAALMYYSKFFRVAVGGLRLHKLEFEFTARSADWVLFVLANMAIVVCTLGIGYIFMPYRNWTFFVRHMEAYGEINLDELTQSETKRAGHGEGLLDAFDVGAI
ncbi:MAG: YjgN family protein [Sphingorhabdus sp.]